VSGDGVRVRFAPAPTGLLHIGNARTALFNWLFARHHRGTFILRVDDTDEARSTEDAMSGIFDALEWLGLNWDEGPGVGGPHGPYVQSQRVERHRACTQRLLDQGAAYRCYCTKEELDAKRAQAEAERRPYRYDRRCLHATDAQRRAWKDEGRPATVRLRVESQTIRVPDLVMGDVTFEANSLDDFIIVKPPNTPLYNFTSAVDDRDMRVTHVIRGQDHLSNTPKQILICRALGFVPPAFAHIPMVLNAQGRRLSKRDGAVYVGEFRDAGYLPEAMVNYLVRLSWSADGVEEVFTVDELQGKFDLDRVGKSPSRFDPQKLVWLNGQYLARKTPAERAALTRPFLERARLPVADVPSATLERIVAAVGDRLRTLADIVPYAAYFFDDAYALDADAVRKWFRDEQALQHLTRAANVLADVEPFDAKTLETRIASWIASLGAKPIRVLQPLRVAVTGRMVGPGLYDVLEILGKEKVLARIGRASAMVRSFLAASSAATQASG
jgi:glutamyl-tRNA synthetase